MSKDKIAILKDTHSVDLRVRRQGLREGCNARGAGTDGEVVLDVLVRIDEGKGRGVARLEGLQQIDNLLLYSSLALSSLHDALPTWPQRETLQRNWTS